MLGAGWSGPRPAGCCTRDLWLPTSRPEGEVRWRAVSRRVASRPRRNPVCRLLPAGQRDRPGEGNHSHRPGRPTMISNERQYRITKNQAERFEQALAQLEQSDRPERMRRIMRDGMESQLQELREELAEYDAL